MKPMGLGDAIEHLGALELLGSKGVVPDVGDSLMAFRIVVASIRLHRVGAQDDVGEE